MFGKLSVFTFIGVGLYLALYLVDRFLYSINDWIYVSVLGVCVILLVIGLVQSRKGK